jgi:AcrR family transcriptional regulator
MRDGHVPRVESIPRACQIFGQNLSSGSGSVNLMARTAKADYRALMTQAARRRLENGEEVAVTGIASELDVSPGLVHFYFGDRQSLVNAAWHEILMAHVSDDLATVDQLAEEANWSGLRSLTDQVFHSSRDAIHLAHLRASMESQQNDELAQIFDAATDVTTRYWRDQISAGVAVGVARTPLSIHALAILIMSVPLGVSVAKPRLTQDERMALSEAWSTMLRAVLEPGFSMDAVTTSATENPSSSHITSA